MDAVVYTTIAVILWSGELGLGHYTTITKMCSVWKLFNDQSVSVIGDDAYFVHAMKNNIYDIPYSVIDER